MSDPLSTMTIHEIKDLNPEADVFVICRTEIGSIQVSPLWECDMTKSQLSSYALQTAVMYADTVSEGAVTCTIIDLRESA